MNRTRMICPHHKRLCYGRVQHSYDTTRIFYDCGTFLDWWYCSWSRPNERMRRSTYPLRRLLHLPQRQITESLRAWRSKVDAKAEKGKA